MDWIFRTNISVSHILGLLDLPLSEWLSVVDHFRFISFKLKSLFVFGCPAWTSIYQRGKYLNMNNFPCTLNDSGSIFSHGEAKTDESFHLDDLFKLVIYSDNSEMDRLWTEANEPEQNKTLEMAVLFSA